MVKLKKKLLNPLLLEINKNSEVYAPIKREITKFELLEDPNLINFSENSYFPIKEHFFKKEEVLFKFTNNRLTQISKTPPKKVFLGVRRCDLNAIKHQDFIFIEQHKDPYYKKEREKTLLIGYHCNKPPSKYCFCESMNLIDFYDLMLFDKGTYFIIDAKTKNGKKFLKKYKKFFEKTNYKLKEKDKHIKTRKLKKTDISNLYNHKNWKKGVNLCLSCAACTEMCPTCYCHEIHDRVSIHNPKKGERIRCWSSCQLKDFTKVAGGHVFRENREHRFKHRIYHQIQYFKEKNNTFLCTGCGRCISGCPTRIDWVKLINVM